MLSLWPKQSHCVEFRNVCAIENRLFEIRNTWPFLIKKLLLSVHIDDTLFSLVYFYFAIFFYHKSIFYKLVLNDISKYIYVYKFRWKFEQFCIKTIAFIAIKNKHNNSIIRSQNFGCADDNKSKIPLNYKLNIIGQIFE